MITVLGASSQIGYFLLSRLAQAHYSVLAISRNGAPDWGVLNNICWMQHDLDEQILSNDASVLISAGSLRHAAQVAEHMPRLQQVVAVSSSSVANKQGSATSEEQRVLAELQEGEQRLQALCTDRGLILTLLRPTMVYGCGLDKNLSRIAAWLQKRPWFPLAAPAHGLRQPVHADDIAKLCVHCLDLREDAAGRFDIGGATRLSYREMVLKTAKAINQPVRFIPLPASLLSLGLNGIARLPAFRGLNGAMVKRQNQDLVVDNSAAMKSLNWQPRIFEPTADCFAKAIQSHH
jgi:nucleoside-diphosphate-sugar epimerase